MRPLILIALTIVAVPDRQDPSRKEVKPVQEQLLGEWQFVKAVVAGRDDLVGMKNMVLIFEKDVIHVRENGQMKQGEDAGYRIDASKKPIAIDLMPKNSPNNEKVLGILKLENDVLVICFGDGPGMAGRPADFDSGPNSKAAMLYLKRVKK